MNAFVGGQPQRQRVASNRKWRNRATRIILVRERG